VLVNSTAVKVQYKALPHDDIKPSLFPGLRMSGLVSWFSVTAKYPCAPAIWRSRTQQSEYPWIDWRCQLTSSAKLARFHCVRVTRSQTWRSGLRHERRFSAVRTSKESLRKPHENIGAALASISPSALTWPPRSDCSW